jgi:hypothetical protein
MGPDRNKNHEEIVIVQAMQKFISANKRLTK